MEDLTGFGHLSYDLLELLGDDYPRSPVMLYALRMPQASVENPSRAINLHHKHISLCGGHLHSPWAAYAANSTRRQLDTSLLGALIRRHGMSSAVCAEDGLES